MIGKIISHYKILEKLGEGGMGAVYKAQDTKLYRTVAIKFLPPSLTADADAKERFIQEAQVASSLQHHNICNIHDIDETPDGQLFIVMDYYQGETLKEAISKGPLAVGNVIEYAVQIAAGLNKAHEKSIVHRDLKPANVMITVDGVVKILDFGLAKLQSQTKLTKTGSTLGTAPYMSPEQTHGDKVDQRTDVWSFGTVLYEMITGQLPFKGDYEQAMVYSILNEKPEPPTGLRTGIPMEVERIIFKCLEKKASDRYQHMDELIVDLRKVSLKTTTPVIKPRRRLKSVWIAVTVILIALIGLYFLLPIKSEVSGKSIAVLPFQNLSTDGPYAYFAGGLHDELLTQLSKVAALKVISRTSVMGYQGTKIPLKQIAKELGVGSIVEGSVQVVGEQLRVNVQLIKASTDAHLWAERYDRTLDDAFAIQSDVAQQIVSAVGAALSKTEQQGLASVPTTNAEAYRLYLQGREYFTRPGFLRQNLEVAQEIYQRALALDPGFALAHAEISEVHGLIYWQSYDPSPTRAARQREEAETALRLAPELPQAHAAMGRAYYFGRRDYNRALEEYELALKRLPNDSELWFRIAAVYRRLGNWKEALKAVEKAKLLDPRNADLYYDLDGATHYVLHDYAEAVRAYEEALSLAPDLHEAAVYKGWTYVCWQGQLDTLRAVIDQLPDDADLGDYSTKAAQKVRLLYWERQTGALLDILRAMPVMSFESYYSFLPKSLYVAWAYQLTGDGLSAGNAFDSALTLLDSKLLELPDDWRIHASRGLTLAGLGRQEEALQEARWLQQSKVYREDALQGPVVAEFFAQILAQAGKTSAALDEIERLLKGPSYLSVHTLRLDPLWDQIHNHSRFKELLVKYAQH